MHSLKELFIIDRWQLSKIPSNYEYILQRFKKEKYQICLTLEVMIMTGLFLSFSFMFQSFCDKWDSHL